MQEVVRQLSKRLATKGHTVTVATRKTTARNSKNIEGVQIVEFDIRGNLVEGISGEVEKYQQFLLSSHFDIVTFFAAQQWATDLALPLLNQIKGKKVSVPTGYSGFYIDKYQGYYEQMKTWIHGFDMNVYLSENYRDINFAKANGITNTLVIPNGAAEDEFLHPKQIDIRRKFEMPSSHLLLLHIGSFTGIKGHREAIEIALKLRNQNITLLMIGNNLEKMKMVSLRYPIFSLRYLWNQLFGKKRIITTFISREETVAAYKTADLFLFPSNIECSPIVLFEAAAAKLPFASSDVGNASEIALWTEGGIVLPTQKNKSGYSYVSVNKSVKLVDDLLDNKSKRHAMGEAAFANWKSKFSWEIIAKTYENMYLTLINAA